MSLRPEFIKLSSLNLPPDADKINLAEGQALVKSFAGNLVEIIVEMADGSEIHVEDRPQNHSSEPGD